MGTVNKGTVTHSIVHRVLREFMENAEADQKQVSCVCWLGCLCVVVSECVLIKRSGPDQHSQYC